MGNYKSFGDTKFVPNLPKVRLFGAEKRDCGVEKCSFSAWAALQKPWGPCCVGLCVGHQTPSAYLVPLLLGEAEAAGVGEPGLQGAPGGDGGAVGQLW